MNAENKFKVASKRNRMLGRWAAEKMNLESNLVEDYIESVIEADFEKPGHDDVLEKINNDFKNKNLEITANTIESKLNEFEKLAFDEINNQ